MGVIKRQGIKQSIIRYLGIAIGFLSTLFVYPLVLEEIGLVRFLQNTAWLLVPFALLGSHNIAIRFFPMFRDSKAGHNGFLPLMLLWGLGGFLLTSLILYLSYDQVVLQFSDKPSLYQDYLPYTLVFAFFIVFSQLLTNYISNFQRIVVPALFNELFIKLALPALILGYYFGWISLDEVIWYFLAAYLLVLVALLIYLYFLGEGHFFSPIKPISQTIRKELSSFALYNILGSWGYILANRIDIFMLGLLLPGAGSLKSIGIYSINFFVSEVIDAPRKALFNITSPIVAQAFKEDDLTKVQDLYQRSALNQLAIGWLFFLGIWANLDDLFALMPNGDEVALGKYVVLFLGLGKIFDMATGINGIIIQHSPYYRFNLVAVAIMAVVNIGNNWWMIPAYDILGASIATLVSIFLFNLIKLGYIYQKMKMHPFNWQTMGILLAGLLIYGSSLLLPSVGESILAILLDMIFRSIWIGGSYVAAIYYFGLSEDINDLIRDSLQKIRR